MDFTFGNYEYVDEIITKLPLGWKIACGLISLAMTILSIIAMWKVFVKAGEKGWKSLIPFYNMYILFKLCWDTQKFWIYLILTIVVSLTAGAAEAFTEGSAGNIIFYIISILASAFLLYVEVVLFLNLAKAFGHGKGFGIGLLFLEFIFMMILAFDSSKYIGNPTQTLQNQNPTDSNKTDEK